MPSRRVLLTGSSGGIGSITALAFADEGWTVIGLDRRPPAANVASAIKYVQCDVSSTEEIRAAVRSHVGAEPLHALVNNAAVQLNKPLAATTDEEWAMVMDTNVRSAFVLMRESHDALAAASGSVVNVSSVHAIATSANVAAYAASKGALVALTRAAAVEFAGRNIRCNAVLPGAVDTDMLRDGLGRRPHPEGPTGNLRDLIQRTPLLGVGDPYDIATAVLFLADNTRAPFMTGQALVVDGGATARLSTE